MKLNGELKSLRNNITDTTLGGFLGLGMITLVLTFFRSVSTHDFLVFYTNLLTAVILALIYLFRKKIGIEIKILIVGILIWITLFLGLLKVGIFASAINYITLLVVITTLVLSLNKALVLLVVYLITFVVFWILYSKKIIVLDFDANQYAVSTSVWLVELMAVIITSFGLLLISSNNNKVILKNYTLIQEQNNVLTDREKKFRILFETSNDAIILIENHKYTDCNKKTYALFQCERDYIIGKEPHEFSPEYQPDGILSNVKANSIFESVYKGNSEVFEWQHLTQNGNPIDVSVSLNLIQLNDKEYVQAVLRDITESKQQQLELERHKTNLENLVLERTYELEATNEELRSSNEQLFYQKEELQNLLKQLQNTQHQLIEAEKMASIGILTAGVAHEINNPLNFIQTGLYSLEEIHSDKEMEANQKNELLNKVTKNMAEGVTRINDIVQSMRQFSRSDAKAHQDCDIHQIIDNCCQILNHEIKYKVTLKKNYYDKKILLDANEGQLHQVFLNLINNGIQAIPDKGELVISTSYSSDNKKVIISIEDDGDGIPDEVMKHIFEPFYTTKETGVGTGLGLYIVFKIVTEHKGKISVTNSDKKGAKFSVEFPNKA